MSIMCIPNCTTYTLKTWVTHFRKKLQDSLQVLDMHTVLISPGQTLKMSGYNTDLSGNCQTKMPGSVLTSQSSGPFWPGS